MVEKCPVCNGSGIVSKRMYEAPGQNCSWGSYINENEYTKCHSCGGEGILKKYEWIKLTPDTTPKEDEYVLVTVVWSGEKHVEQAQYQGGEFLSDADDICGDRFEVIGVTHWMPMPSPSED